MTGLGNSSNLFGLAYGKATLEVAQKGDIALFKAASQQGRIAGGIGIALTLASVGVDIAARQDNTHTYVDAAVAIGLTAAGIFYFPKLHWGLRWSALLMA